MVSTDVDIDPETQEVWAGVRRASDKISALQSEVEDLQAELSGFTTYKQFLKDSDSFAELESNLKLLAADLSNVSDADVEQTRSDLEANFTDFSTYKGDESSTGVYSNTTFDDYRSYLTTNGLSEIDADIHIQLLKDLFDDDATAASETGTHDSWDTLQTELENNGVTASSAETTVTDLKSVFASVRELDQQILIADSWSAFDTELEDRGLTSTEAGDIVDDLKTAYGNTLDSAAKDNFSQFATFTDLKDWLKDNGFTQSEADRIVEQLKDADLTIDDVRAILAEEGLTGLLNAVASTQEFSEGGAGIKIWEAQGTTLSGQTAVKGGLSIRGKEVYIEQTEAPGDEAGVADITWSNISADPTSVAVGDFTTVSATAENTSSDPVEFTAKLIVDGDTVRTRPRQIDGSTTRTISLKWNPQETGEVDAQINSSGTVAITVTPEAITT